MSKPNPSLSQILAARDKLHAAVTAALTEFESATGCYAKIDTLVFVGRHADGRLELDRGPIDIEVKMPSAVLARPRDPRQPPDWSFESPLHDRLLTALRALYVVADEEVQRAWSVADVDAIIAFSQRPEAERVEANCPAVLADLFSDIPF